jgi:hypothetical protein
MNHHPGLNSICLTAFEIIAHASIKLRGFRGAATRPPERLWCGHNGFSMRAAFVSIALTLATRALAHDIITTKITFDREIIRIVEARCASCHRPNAKAFSLMTYQDARPWAVAIKEEILSRRMPPWGAVKGFGEFRDEQGLTPEQMELITDWVEGGAPEGEAKDLPKTPKWGMLTKSHEVQIGIASGEYTLKRDTTLGGLLPLSIPPKASIRIVACLPDGSMEPLLWLETYKPEFGHPFYLRNALKLPAGTVIRGIPTTARLALLAP